MSDLMLFGVLRMPYDLAMADEISQGQFYQRAQQAADRIEALETELAATKANLHTAEFTTPQLFAIDARAMALAAEYFADAELVRLAGIYGFDLIVTLHKERLL